MKRCEVVQVQPKNDNKDITQIGEDYATEDEAGRDQAPQGMRFLTRVTVDPAASAATANSFTTV